MHIEEETKLDFGDVLIRPKTSTMSSRKEVSLERTFVFKHASIFYKGTPIIAANMDTVGTMEMAAALGKHGMSAALHKFYSEEKLINHFIDDGMRENSQSWYTLGITGAEMDKLKTIMQTTTPRFICMDVANGYQDAFIDAVKRLRDLVGTGSVIMAGNVVTGEITETLIKAGADCVKTGIGPGSQCSTRRMTGVGYPQLSAIIECADAAHQVKGRICADGGCRTPGDVAKAFGAGADFVMLGGMLAGHYEGGADIEYHHGKEYMRFYGMSSEEAMVKHYGEVASHRAAEGVSTLIPCKGQVEGTVQEILGGVRSMLTYIGARNLKEAPLRTTFIKVNRIHDKNT